MVRKFDFRRLATFLCLQQSHVYKTIQNSDGYIYPYKPNKEIELYKIDCCRQGVDKWVSDT